MKSPFSICCGNPIYHGDHEINCPVCGRKILGQCEGKMSGKDMMKFQVLEGLLMASFKLQQKNAEEEKTAKECKKEKFDLKLGIF